MLSSAGAYPLALCTARKKPSEYRLNLENNPRSGRGGIYTNGELRFSASPFHAEPKHAQYCAPNAQLGTTSPCFSERRPIPDASHYLPFRAALAIPGSPVACFSLIFASIS